MVWSLTSVAKSNAAVTYYTVSDHRFFLGTVALLNSLYADGESREAGGSRRRLDAEPTRTTRRTRDPRSSSRAERAPSPPDEAVPVPDGGGRDSRRDRQRHHRDGLARLGDRSRSRREDLYVSGVDAEVRKRWFAEWEKTLQLRAPLRRDDWVHNGFVAFSTEHWPQLLERWWEVCELIPPGEMHGSLAPFQAPDADALNALLMSEIPRDALALLAEGEEVFGGDVTVEDIGRSRARPRDGLRSSFIWSITRSPGSDRAGSGSPRQTTSGSCAGSCSRLTSLSASIPTRRHVAPTRTRRRTDTSGSRRRKPVARGPAYKVPGAASRTVPASAKTNEPASAKTNRVRMCRGMLGACRTCADGS